LGGGGGGGGGAAAAGGGGSSSSSRVVVVVAAAMDWRNGPIGEGTSLPAPLSQSKGKLSLSKANELKQERLKTQTLNPKP
jgi:hypothetical protein